MASCPKCGPTGFCLKDASLIISGSLVPLCTVECLKCGAVVSTVPFNNPATELQVQDLRSQIDALVGQVRQLAARVDQGFRAAR